MISTQIKRSRSSGSLWIKNEYILTPYSCLENPVDRGAWWAAVHGVPKSRTRLSDFTFTFHFHALEKEMATHSSVLAWGIPGKGEPGGLPSMGSHRVGHDWRDLAAAAAGMFGEGNGNPLQCSCLENPRDREVWWAPVYGVAQSWTRLKRLSNSSSRDDFWSYKELSRECFYTTMYDFNRNLFTKGAYLHMSSIKLYS